MLGVECFCIVHACFVQVLKLEHLSYFFLAGLQPPRALTVWVGKIAPTVENETIHALLKACGKIKEWKPVLDVDTGKMKSFGFCTFEDAVGAVTALSVLNGREIDGQSLALKPNKVRKMSPRS